MDQKKIFGLLYGVTDLAIGLLCPIKWWLILSLPNLLACWWIVFRSGWM